MYTKRTHLKLHLMMKTDKLNYNFIKLEVILMKQPGCHDLFTIL